MRKVIFIVSIAVFAIGLVKTKADTISYEPVVQPKTIFCATECKQMLVEVCSAKYNACTEIPAQFCLNDVNGVCEYVFISF